MPRRARLSLPGIPWHIIQDLALAWSKTHQKIQPTYAWAYAMEAKLTLLEPDRLRALGIALYLDPFSDRASAFPENIKQRAKKLLEANNPFREGAERKAAKKNIALLEMLD